MKWLFISAATALSLAVTTPAWTAPGPLSGQSSRPQSAPYGQRLAQNDHQHQGKQGGGQGVRKGQTVRTNQRQQTLRSQRYNWGSYQPGHRPPDWNSHRNFDRGAWQGNEQAQRRYHWNSYQRPPGWYYRRWTYGMILPSLFWGRQYWIDSYWTYGLSDPPYGYVWVRYGDDALLVNVEDGDILRVIYGLYD